MQRKKYRHRQKCLLLERKDLGFTVALNIKCAFSSFFGRPTTEAVVLAPSIASPSFLPSPNVACWCELLAVISLQLLFPLVFQSFDSFFR